MKRAECGRVAFCALKTRLLRLLCGFLGKLAFAPSLRCLRARFSVQHVIPPSKAARIVSDEALVMYIVVIRSSPEWKKMTQAHGEVVPAVCVDGLEKSEDDPHIHGQYV